jgi:hypothetical protein
MAFQAMVYVCDYPVVANPHFVVLPAFQPLEKVHWIALCGNRLPENPLAQLLWQAF